MPRLIDIDGKKGFHGLEVLVPVLEIAGLNSTSSSVR